MSKKPTTYPDVSPTVHDHAFIHGQYLIDQINNDRPIDSIKGPTGGSARSAAMAFSFDTLDSSVEYMMHQISHGPAKDLFQWFNRQQVPEVYQRLLKAFHEATPNNQDVILGPHVFRPLLMMYPPEEMLNAHKGIREN